ncbi:hypothetical protein BQ8794_290123 [Mesorhizobium prunaredense]|uniref:Uncharacterized protein n=1 Tax=Mesorhizobium prunaredense TaxID=1631249 RepID=A0A1R3VB58_9HYPH|nr:hypothetical protein BQ8794_290123 [Mesorhizobium prunaredense]
MRRSSPWPLRGARINFPGLERVYQLEIAKGLRRTSAAFFAAMLPNGTKSSGPACMINSALAVPICSSIRLIRPS